MFYGISIVVSYFMPNPVFIYVYTTSQKYLVTLKKFYFSSRSVILMKQIKHHNVFIYYTKYKSSWVTLDTN